MQFKDALFSVPTNGTTVKFVPFIAQDTMMKNSLQTTIQTKHQCITAMKVYEGKSMEVGTISFFSFQCTGI